MSNFVARDDIPWGGVLAHSRGQTITAEQAEGLKAAGLGDYLVGENTKEGREIKADVSGQPLSAFETGSGTTSTSRTAAKTQES